jgi:hypothetical protein
MGVLKVVSLLVLSLVYNVLVVQVLSLAEMIHDLLHIIILEMDFLIMVYWYAYIELLVYELGLISLLLKAPVVLVGVLPRIY